MSFHTNMYDPNLKPTLLTRLTKDHLPDDNINNNDIPFPSPQQLSNLVSSIKNLGLLSEAFREGKVDGELVRDWKVAVDGWVDKLLVLASSNMPDKCWAGISLLGVTCQECSDDRFLASYSAWFLKLLPQFQTPVDSQFVKVASCASMSDFFIRLSGFPNVKKEAISLSGKLIQPLLKLLSEDDSEALWEAAVDLLCTIMKFFPSSVSRSYDNAEAVLYTKIMSVKCNASMSKKFANCLALLPKTKGDESNWSLMMQKILLTISNHLTVVFQGLEREGRDREALKFLVPPGKDAPPPLGGETASQIDRKSEQLIMSKTSVLLSCCCKMLNSSYPVQVTVPIQPLLDLVSRVLSVDGSLSPNAMPCITVMQQEFICSDLFSLHLHGLDLLTAIIKGIRSQLLPHAAGVVRLLKEYFKNCELPALRIKVYSVMQSLLISMGVGMALCLDQEVINNATVDLDSVGCGSGLASSNTYSSAATYKYNPPTNRKRKQGALSVPLAEHQRSEVEPKNKPVTPITVQIAALQALEALLTVGGALKSESWRSDVDLLLITVATKACDGKWVNEENIDSISSSDLTPTWADFQLAALRALLASLLSPALHRPPFLAEGLLLFRRGKQETGTKLAELCVHALMALEVLIHPRALPLEDFPSCSHAAIKKGYEGRSSDTWNSAEKHATDPQKQKDDLIELCESWVNCEGITDKSTRSTEPVVDIAVEPSQKLVPVTAEDPPAGKLLLETQVEIRLAEEANTNVVSEAGNRDVCMDDVERYQTPIFSADAENSDRVAMMSSDVLSAHQTDDGIAIVNAGDLPVQSETNELFTENKDVDSDVDSLPELVTNNDADSDS